MVAGACAPCVLLSGPAASLCKWFSTDQSGSYSDALPSCCVSAPCGTKECLLICPITAWRNHIAFPFRVSRKILTDNGTEFKNSLFAEVAKELGLERKIYSPPYRPQSNGVLEGFHKFLKSSFSKHISRHKEWDDVAAMAAASYNYMPNQHSKEAPFFVWVLTLGF